MVGVGGVATGEDAEYGVAGAEFLLRDVLDTDPQGGRPIVRQQSGYGAATGFRTSAGA